MATAPQAPTWISRLDFTEGLGTLCPVRLGKIMVFGDSVDETSDFTLARLNSDGSLDTSFGNQGVIEDTFSFGEDTIFFALSAYQQATDGKVVLAGVLFADDIYAAMARFDENGHPDDSFASNGKLVLEQLSSKGRSRSSGAESPQELRTSSDAGLNAIPLPQGGYLLASADTGYLIRLLPDGALDPAFAETGYLLPKPVENFELTGAILLDDKIIVAGDAGNSGCVARYTLTGELDITFAEQGSRLITYPGASRVRLMTVSTAIPRVFTVAGLATRDNHNSSLLARLSAAGDVLPDFPVLLAPGGRQGDFRYVTSRLIPQIEERIHAVGQTTKQGGADPRYFTAAYRANGELDKGFADNGWSLGPVAASAYGMYLIPGNLLIGGRIRKFDGSGHEGLVAGYSLNTKD
ncbi:hypothetical protein LOY54_02305 [Pseudomonas sp. B21-032]|uniref:hypothetical protein n=1 Tax=Pseudomonas sp. B21-032 TaxID=2895483 RepID=UPI0021601F81|nr:hypothetical protein [Pseudomonas sp. B21-032]UVL62124.1 hypothetical protein LOY54_02305 [Pseudomonas sp. B21-032]